MNNFGCTDKASRTSDMDLNKQSCVTTSWNRSQGQRQLIGMIPQWCSLNGAGSYSVEPGNSWSLSICTSSSLHTTGPRYMDGSGILSRPRCGWTVAEQYRVLSARGALVTARKRRHSSSLRTSCALRFLSRRWQSHTSYRLSSTVGRDLGVSS